MPLYEYQCSRCRRKVEKIQSFSAEPLTVCESCGGPLEKLISASAIQFKGSGWYVTDYAKKASAPPAKPESNPSSGNGGGAGGDGKAAPAETKSEAGAGSKSEGKTEGKTEGKSEAKPAPSG